MLLLAWLFFRNFGGLGSGLQRVSVSGITRRTERWAAGVRVLGLGFRV